MGPSEREEERERVREGEGEKGAGEWNGSTCSQAHAVPFRTMSCSSAGVYALHSSVSRNNF